MKLAEGIVSGISILLSIVQAIIILTVPGLNLSNSLIVAAFALDILKIIFAFITLTYYYKAMYKNATFYVMGVLNLLFVSLVGGILYLCTPEIDL